MATRHGIFAAVRLCPGDFEYVDADTIAETREGVEKRVAKDLEIIPSWCAERPVIRIAEFTMVEKEVAK